MPGTGGRVQRIYVFLENLPGGYEVLAVQTPFAESAGVDFDALLKDAGTLACCALGYMSGRDAQGAEVDGHLLFSSSIPLEPLDLSDGLRFMRYLGHVGATGNRYATTYSAGG